MGSHWLTYNPLHFQHFHESAVENAPGVVGAMLEVEGGVKRVIDVGAGSGAYAAEFKRRGIGAVAVEHSPTGRKMAMKQGVDVRVFDLMETPPVKLEGAFDLAYCFEVAEHLPPVLAEKLVAFVAGAAPRVIWTAARPGQGGTGHINEQPKEHWIGLFEKYGQGFDAEATEKLIGAVKRHQVRAAWFGTNAIVLRRK